MHVMTARCQLFSAVEAMQALCWSATARAAPPCLLLPLFLTFNTSNRADGGMLSGLSYCLTTHAAASSLSVFVHLCSAVYDPAEPHAGRGGGGRHHQRHHPRRRAAAGKGMLYMCYPRMCAASCMLRVGEFMQGGGGAVMSGGAGVRQQRSSSSTSTKMSRESGCARLPCRVVASPCPAWHTIILFHPWSANSPYWQPSSGWLLMCCLQQCLRGTGKANKQLPVSVSTLAKLLPL
jgi:hypothetical protein